MTGEWLTQLLVALRGVTLHGDRLDLSAEDIADAIWLAPHLVAPDSGAVASSEEAIATTAPDELSNAQAPEDEEEPGETPSPTSEVEGPRRRAGRRGELHLPAADGAGRGGRAIRAPTGAALPGSLALARALRPLRRRMPSRTRRVLDVAETVRRVAEEGVWLPALRPARDRWLDLALVVDSGASMGPWRSTATELQKLLSCIGAFRTVRVWNLETDTSPPRLRAGLVGRNGAPERDPRELVDPAGRSLVLVLTDCVAGSWYDGGAAQLLENWARNGPVSLFLVLPEHLWPRTALGTSAAVRLKAPYAAAPNARLESRLIDAWADLPEWPGAPLPVASLLPEALTAWARLVAGAGGAESAGFVLERKPSALPPHAPATAISPATRLSRFWQSASPTARRLAGLLAASPVISLPVIRLIRQALVPEARQVHEAEVLLGDLLRVVTFVGEPALDPDEIRYEFRGGLRSRLLDAVPSIDALTVLEQVSSYVEKHFELGVDFRAVLADPGAARGCLVADESPFARVAAEVLSRLGGDYARLIGDLPVEAVAADGAVRDTSEAAYPSPPGRVGGTPPLEDPPDLSRATPPRSHSLQQKLRRVRPPRVNITYEVETAGAKVNVELPFIIGVLGDFSGKPTQAPKPLKDRKFILIDRDNFDDVMAAMSPGLEFRVANTLRGDGSELAVRLTLNTFENLDPGQVVQQVEPLMKLFEARGNLRELLTRVDGSDALENLLEQIATSNAEITILSEQLSVDEPGGGTGASVERSSTSAGEQQEPASHAPAAAAETHEVSLLDQVISATKHTERPRAKELIKTFVDQLIPAQNLVPTDVAKTINAAVRTIDDKLSKQLCAIMHHPDFKKLEGTWRGLHYLVCNSETSALLKIKVLNVSQRELYSDAEKAVEFDQSQLFKKVYEQEFGTPGGEPFGALVGDYEFTNSPGDIDLLSKLSNVAAAAFCPLLSAAHPNFFGFESWQEISRPRDLEKIVSTTSYTKWNSFRDSEDARFVCLVMPRVRARLPYGANTKPIEEFAFEEVDEISPLSEKSVTWINAAYGLATRLTEAFAKSGSCTAIRGVEGGGKVEGLPSFLSVGDDGDKDLKSPVEVGITDRREFELSKMGFLPLCHYKNTDYAVFLGGQTAQRPKKYDRPEATANAAIAASLPYIMATSRFAHYIKVMARSWIGSFREVADVENSLNRWIENYVNASTTVDQEIRTKYPLREAKVVVREVPGKPGSYDAVAWLAPWLQLEEPTAAMRMIVSIPKLKDG
jgi:type VI secretion system protein ImpC